MAEFEVFSKALVPLKQEPSVTIQKNGVISLNRTAMLALGNPDAVELLFDQRTRTVGMRTVDAQVEHACTVRSVAGPSAGPFVISARAFLSFYEIQPHVSQRWRAYRDGDVLCVDIDDEAVVVTSNRAKRARVPGRH